MQRRYAFTLIELIFAIVIIAISVLSLPMMNQTIEKGVSSNVLQEAIFAASAELNEAITAHWDENSMEPSGSGSFARVIDASLQNCDNNTSSPTYRRMPGHITQPLHRRCLDNNSTTPSNTDITDVTSLSDMEHTTLIKIFEHSTAEASGYKNEYKSKLEVTRPANFNGSNDNIKQVESTITDSDDNVLIVLRSYSANIGEVDYYKRNY